MRALQTQWPSSGAVTSMSEFFWVLVLVTATSVEQFDAEGFGMFLTHEQCHQTATKVFWEDMPMNVEAVCIRVGNNGESDECSRDGCEYVQGDERGGKN